MYLRRRSRWQELVHFCLLGAIDRGAPLFLGTAATLAAAVYPKASGHFGYIKSLLEAERQSPHVTSFKQMTSHLHAILFILRAITRQSNDVKMGIKMDDTEPCTVCITTTS